ncbi:MAG: alpha/beta fold hydrolase [Deltaproteobacteria bacterium]|nr:alpha/beta fold hydrolase [Deltaproteobacteria bacterium]
MLIFDNRGVGQTEAPPTPNTIRVMADDTIALMDALDIERTTLVGHSMGGAIALQMSLIAPDRISQTVICASAARLPYPSVAVIKVAVKYREMDLDPTLIFETTFPWIYGEAFLRDEARVRTQMDQLLQNPYPQSLDHFRGQVAACESFDLERAISEVRTDTLVVAGNEDVLTPLRCSEYLHQNIAGSRLVVMNNCGHMIQHEQPSKLAETILTFLH